MKKRIISLIFAVVIACITLSSCGGNDASMNNGSDTGVSRNTNDNMMDDITDSARDFGEDVQKAGEALTDDTIFDANTDYSNVDQYSNSFGADNQIK